MKGDEMKFSRKRQAYMAAMERAGKMPRDPADHPEDEDQRFGYGGRVENEDERVPEHFNSSGDPGIDDDEDEEQDMRYMAQGGMADYGQERGDRPRMREELEIAPDEEHESDREEYDERRDERMGTFRRMSKGGMAKGLFAHAIKRSRGGFC